MIRFHSVVEVDDSHDSTPDFHHVRHNGNMLLGEDWKACTTLGAIPCDPVAVFEIRTSTPFTHHPSSKVWQ